MFENLLTLFLVCLCIYLLGKLDSYVIKKFIFYYKFFMFYFLLMLSSFVFLPIFLFRPRNVLNGIMYARYTKHLTKIFGIKWHILNGDVLTGDHGAVIIANHRSIFDSIGIFNVWETAGKVRIIMKKELLWTGIFAWAAYLGGAIFIDRKNAKNAHITLELATDALVKQKSKIWIYPEGTRNTSEHTKLLPFKKGAFNMAVAGQVPIIPIVMSPYYFIDTKKCIFDSGHIFIQCLEPVSTVGLTQEDVPELAERLHGIMWSAYEKLSDEVMNKLVKNNVKD